MRALLIALLLLAGCAAAPTDREIERVLGGADSIAKAVLESLNAPAASVLAVMDEIESTPMSFSPGLVKITRADCNLKHRWLAPSIATTASCNAGKEFIAIFNRGYTHAPGGQRPAWLLVSTAKLAAPVDLSGLGFDDCLFMLDKPNALTPDGSVLRNETNRMTLRLRPPEALSGATFHIQAVWVEPHANERHTLFSDLLEITVGSPR